MLAPPLRFGDLVIPVIFGINNLAATPFSSLGRAGLVISIETLKSTSTFGRLFFGLSYCLVWRFLRSEAYIGLPWLLSFRVTSTVLHGLMRTLLPHSIGYSGSLLASASTSPILRLCYTVFNSSVSMCLSCSADFAASCALANSARSSSIARSFIDISCRMPSSSRQICT